MNDDFEFESGWKEVGRIARVLVLGALVILGSLFFLDLFFPERQSDFNADAVVANIDATSGNCPADFPLEVRLTNVADKEVLNLGFIVYVTDAGHSTEYYSKVIGSDRIIPPDHEFYECYAIPAFQVGDEFARPAESIPFNLASPEYQIRVSGVRLRDEN